MKHLSTALKLGFLGIFLVLSLISAVPQPSQALLAAGHCDPTPYICKYFPDGSIAPGSWHEPQ